MCRLYMFFSTSPRKVECELIQSQNSLLSQSEKDQRGLQNKDGWGLGQYYNDKPHLVKQAEFAKNSQQFRWSASESYSNNVLSHIRRATIGNVSWENTHPFVEDNLMLAHNGNVENFDYVRGQILMLLNEEEQNKILGSTDSEHILALVNHYYNKNTSQPLYEALRTALTQINQWSLTKSKEKKSALNIILSNGHEIAASCFNRKLYYTYRDSVHPCEVCAGQPLHIQGQHPHNYKALVIASEIITSNETWHEMPNESLIWADKNLKPHLLKEKLFVPL